MQVSLVKTIDRLKQLVHILNTTHCVTLVNYAMPIQHENAYLFLRTFHKFLTKHFTRRMTFIPFVSFHNYNHSLNLNH